MNKIKLYIYLFLSVSMVSCNNFLDINPKAEVVNKDMFDNAQGCEDAIMGLYGQLKSEALYGQNISWRITDVLAQDFDVKTISTTDKFQYLATYNYNDATSIIDTMWIEAYRIIGHANNAITNIESQPSSTFPLYNIYLGECYGIRAMLHFEMLRLFAPHVTNYGTEQGIPYVTEYTFKHTPFSTVSKCYEYLISDLKKAQSFLVDDQQYMTYPRAEVDKVKINFLKGRELHFNYYAVTALLARVYWTMGDLKNAKTEALKVIDSEKFPLAQKDEVQNMISGSLSPKESIFGIYSVNYFEKVKELHSTNSTGSMGLFRDATSAGYPLTYNAVYAKDLGANSGSDARLRWFNSMADGDTGTGYMCFKLLDRTRMKFETDTPDKRNLIEGISVLRVVEMYYIVAEALLAENSSEAVNYFNEVLLARGLTKLEDRQPAITLTNDMIYNERHKEFFCEGQRWFDMKRANREIISNSEKKVIPASNQYYVLPIPDAEFDFRN